MKQWVCRVCRYMESGELPPDACPVCRSPARSFEELDDGVTEPEIRRPLSLLLPAEETLWRCQVCGAEHRGARPPDICPKCGVGPELWDEVAKTRPRMDTDEGQIPGVLTCAVCLARLGPEPRPACQICGARIAWLSASATQVGSSEPPSPSPASRSYLIVGSGIAALRAAESIRANDASARVTLLTREPCLPYDRRNLTRYLDGDVEAASIMLRSPDWYTAQGIEIRLETDVVSVNPRARTLRTRGRELVYDRLVLATGARVAVPPIPGVWLEGVQPLRSMKDCARVLNAAGVGRRVVVLGGGVLGLETAAGLRRRGCDVTVCERGDHVMRKQLDVAAARLLQQHLEQLGIRFLLGCQAESVEGEEQVRGVRLAGGNLEPADLVIVATGIVPNTDLARSAGLATGRGIIIDDACRTSDPHIYAAGDCVEHKGLTYGLWPDSMAMGAVAGMNAAGGHETFTPPLHANILKVVDLDLCSIGRVSAVLPTDRELVHAQDAGATYQKVLLDGERLAGAVLLGETHPMSAIAEAIRSGLDVSRIIEEAGTLQRFLSVLPERV